MANCQVSQGNIRVQAARPVWGDQHTTCVHTRADDTSDLQNTGFTGKFINVEGVASDYYVWFNVGAAGVDPELNAGVGVEVAISADASAVAVATALVTAINTEVGLLVHAKRFNANEVIIQNKLIGNSGPIADGLSGDATGFEFSALKLGSRLDIGLTNDFEIGFEETLLDVTASQTGPEILARLRTGNQAGPISIPMKESDAAKLTELLKVGGEVVEVDGDDIVGWGSSKQFTNVIPDSKMLVFEPVGASDRSEDLVFWLAYPNINSINFSGSEERIVEVEFTIYKDKSKLEKLDLFILGDYTKNYLKTLVV